jgi:hypothetical protein
MWTTVEFQGYSPDRRITLEGKATAFRRQRKSPEEQRMTNVSLSQPRTNSFPWLMVRLFPEPVIQMPLCDDAE